MSKKIELQEGKVYKFDAQRKGRFTGKVLAVRDEWVDVSVCAGTAGAMLPYNERHAGDDVTLRISFINSASLVVTP